MTLLSRELLLPLRRQAGGLPYSSMSQIRDLDAVSLAYHGPFPPLPSYFVHSQRFIPSCSFQTYHSPLSGPSNPTALTTEYLTLCSPFCFLLYIPAPLPPPAGCRQAHSHRSLPRVPPRGRLLRTFPVHRRSARSRLRPAGELVCDGGAWFGHPRGCSARLRHGMEWHEMGRAQGKIHIS